MLESILFHLIWQFQVLNLDGTPAKLVVVSVEPGSMLVRTGDNGFAKLPINTEENSPKLTITVSTYLWRQNDKGDI